MKWFVLMWKKAHSPHSWYQPVPIFLLLSTQQVVSFLKFNLQSKLATRALDIRVHDQEPKKREERKGRKTLLPTKSTEGPFLDTSSALPVYMSGHPSWEEGQKPSSLSHTLSSRIKSVL